MSDYTPTTDEVRGAWVAARCTSDGQMPYEVAQFDRWLAKHDREVAARALEEAADLRHGTDLTPTVMSLGPCAGPDPAWWYQYLQDLDETWRANLRARAKRAKEGRG